MNYQEALKVIKTISIYYQNFVITEERVKEWALIVQEYELNQVMNNLKEYAIENRFPPTLSDLIQQETHNKRAAYLPNTSESTQISAEEARRFLEVLEQPKITDNGGGISFSKAELRKMMDELRGGN